MQSTRTPTKARISSKERLESVYNGHESRHKLVRLQHVLVMVMLQDML